MKRWGGGTKADRRIPLWTGTATAHRLRHECNIKDAKSAYATFFTTNAARRKGGISAEEAGIIFRDTFLQAGATTTKSNPKRGKKRPGSELLPPGNETVSSMGPSQTPARGPTRARKRQRQHQGGAPGPPRALP